MKHWPTLGVIAGCVVGLVLVFVVWVVTAPEQPQPPTTPPSYPYPVGRPGEPVYPRRPAAPPPAPEVEIPEPARYTVHDVKDHSFGARSRRTVEVTTPETEPARQIEALMRAAVEVQRRTGANAVTARRWIEWPVPPTPSDAEFQRMTPAEQSALIDRMGARDLTTYSPDRRGWAGDGGGTWTDVSRAEIPEWIRQLCPGLRANCRWWDR